MDDNGRKLTKAQLKEIDKINEAAEIRSRVEAELKANIPMQEYLATFNPGSAEQFADNYLTSKTLWHQYGAFFLKQKENHEMEWIEAANEHLGNILQKKLFDKQCLWRAEQETLPGVEICFDFLIWEHNILNCPFIEPITAEDVELYQEYLRTNANADIENNLYYSLVSWQSYDELKAAYNTGHGRANFPEWYEFYNSRRGTGVYMSLPNIRGTKENEYMRLGLGLSPEREKAIDAINDVLDNPGKPVIDKEGRPFLYQFDEDKIRYCVENFEDKLTKKYYKASKWFYNEESDEEEILEVIDMFIRSGEKIPIEENDDWKDALFEASRKFKIEKIAEAMEDAFEQYQLTLSMGIGFPKKDNDSTLQGTRKALISDIIKGRKLKGEPGNLDF